MKMSVEEDYFSEDDDDDTSVHATKRRIKLDSTAQNGRTSSAVKKLRASRRTFQEKATISELDALLQAEKSGRASLFDLQVNELLNLKGLEQMTTKLIDESWQKIMQIMQQVNEVVPLNIESAAASFGEICVPGFIFPHHFMPKMSVRKPARWFYIGSYADETLCRHAKTDSLSPSAVLFDVDVVLEMPASVLHEKDHLNGRYFYRRAYYLAWLAKQFTSSAFAACVKDVTYRILPSERHLPVLVLSPAGSLPFRFVVHLCPPEGVLQAKRFHPSQNNIRLKMHAADKSASEGRTDLPPTPSYNSMILKDLLLESLSRFTKTSLDAVRSSSDSSSLVNQSGILKAIALAKSWLEARSMYGLVLNGSQLTMLVLYLAKVEKSINALMSAHHCFRLLLNFLIQWSPRSHILSFSTEKSTDEKAKNLWLNNSYAVFLDPVAGLLNIFETLTESDIEFLKEEAKLMLQQLDALSSNADPNSFQQLFLEPTNFATMFDHRLEIFSSLNVCKKIQEYVEKPENNIACRVFDVMSDYCGSIGRNTVWKVLQRALHNNERCKLIWLQPRAAVEISVRNADAVRSECVPPYKSIRDFGCIWFKFNDNTTFIDTVIRGPEVQSPDAKKFREFWGPLCKLVRFSDTSIAETVVFNENKAADSLGAKRLTTARICRYILPYHFGFHAENDFRYRGGELYNVLQPVRTSWKHDAFDLGEEVYDKMSIVYNKLVKTLKNLGGSDKQLPLQIATVIPISAALQKFDVIAPLPAQFAADSKNIRQALFRRARHIKVPPQTPCLLSHLVLESSGKWPDDSLDAVQRLKSAFQIQIARALRGVLPHSFSGSTGSDVLLLNDAHHTILIDLHRTEGYVFTLRVVYPREAVLAKQRTLPNGMQQMVRTSETDQLELLLHQKPKLVSALNGTAAQHSMSFAVTVRLAKRWMASQLVLSGSGCQNASQIFGGITEEAVELLVASLFVPPYAPYGEAPRTPDTGFVRFLRLLCTHVWQAVPLIVNFSEKLSKQDVEQIFQRFTAQRSTLPPVFIATPFDRFASVWTRGGGGGDSGLVWHRIIQMAEHCLRVMQASSDERKRIFATDPKIILRPPLESFDVTIYLSANLIARRHEALDVLMCAAKIGGKRHPIPVLQYAEANTATDDAAPLCDFDSVAYYIDELRRAYGTLALFFYDQYGGDKVLVLWKRAAFPSALFTPSTAMGRKLLTNAEEKVSEKKQETLNLIVPNIAALLENFRLIGGELVDRVEGHYERWKV